MSIDVSGYRGASPEAIRHHYDLSNDFYALWLDESRTYSCALWDGEKDTLAHAQERKLDYLARESGAVGAPHVLDVGCGWGGMLRRLVERHGVGHVTGLTLSREQADFVAEWNDRRCDVRVQNWSEHEPSGKYDAIVSIGAFEHFSDAGLTRQDRVAGYRRFFERCRDWLHPGGRIALQTIVKGSNVRMERAMVRDMLFVNRKIFPESEVPWPSEMFEASERIFDVVSTRYDAEHYARTCQQWFDLLAERKSEAVELVGDAVVDDYLRYLNASANAFRRRHVGLVRVVFELV